MGLKEKKLDLASSIAAKPGDQGFSPLWKLNLVERNQNVNPRELKPAQEIMGAQQIEVLQ